MSALAPDLRNQIINTLLQAPFTATTDGRNLLLADLPATLRAAITRSENQRVDITAIVNTVATADGPTGQPRPLALMVENALYLVKGSPLDAELRALMGQIPTGGGVVDSIQVPTAPDYERHFQAMLDAMERNDWNTALDLAATLPPDYPGLTPLVERARQAQQQRTDLYNAIGAAAKAQDWSRVLNLAVTLPPGDPIVGAMIEQARQHQATAASPSSQQVRVQVARTSAAGHEPRGLEALAPSYEPLGHTGAITALAWAPDGAHYASASADGTVGIWTPDSATPTRMLAGDGGDLSAVVWSPDGKRIAAAGKSGAILLWDAESGAAHPPLLGHESWVHTLAWPALIGGQLASGDDSGLIRVWPEPSDGSSSLLQGLTGAVFGLSWAPNGRELVSGSWDGTLRLWGELTGGPSLKVSSYGAGFHTVAWGPGGEFIASGSSDKQVRLWNATLRLVCTLTKAGGAAPEAVQTAYQGADYVLPAHDGEVYTVAWRPDGRLLASGASDSTIKIWDSPAWTEHATLTGHQGTVNAVAWSPDGTTLASGADDCSIRLWHIE